MTTFCGWHFQHRFVIVLLFRHRHSSTKTGLLLFRHVIPAATPTPAGATTAAEASTTTTSEQEPPQH